MRAGMVRAPGMNFHWRCVRLGLRLLLNPRLPLRRGWVYMFLFAPIGSTRYFEFDFAWRALADAHVTNYLDVSSPRLCPILLLEAKRDASAELINPDAEDLAITTNLVRACGLATRVHTRSCLIQDAPFEPQSFDAISSLSVLEHIPDVREAVSKMWAWLQPGGKLILSMPCAADAYEQWIDSPVYGLLEADDRGFNFLQTVYDEALLREKIFGVTGEPKNFVLYGERRAGFLRKHLDTRYSGLGPDFWREPYVMGKEFRRFEKIADLPGEGVIALEFVKE